MDASAHTWHGDVLAFHSDPYTLASTASIEVETNFGPYPAFTASHTTDFVRPRFEAVGQPPGSRKTAKPARFWVCPPTKFDPALMQLWAPIVELWAPIVPERSPCEASGSVLTIQGYVDPPDCW